MHSKTICAALARLEFLSDASPEVVGSMTCQYWGCVTDEKRAYETFLEELKIDGKPSRKDPLYETKIKLYLERQKNWKEYIGI